MPGKGDYLELKVLDGVLGGPDFVRPATVYVALFTVTPGEAGGGTEVTGGSYARAAVTNNATNWPAAAAGLKSNGVAITFPTPTATWGVIVAFALLDAAAAGNLLYFGAITPNKTVNNGDPAPSFAIGDLDVTED